MSRKPAHLALLAGLAVLVMPALAMAGTEMGFDANRGVLATFAAAFGVGFLTSLTPCVYPMIPIVLGVFGARDEHVTRRKAFALATAYVLGMGVMYAGLGVLAAGLNKQMGGILANAYVVIPLVLFYVILASSMFGAFEMNLPPSVQARLSQVGGKGYGGAFGMGMVGGLTAAPCTGPFLAGLLAYVASSTGSMALGASLLFVYAMGMGVLFWLLAAFAVSLPKSGRWMESVKSVGGILLLAVGVYFLRPISPGLRKLTDPSQVFLIGAIAVAVVGVGIGAVHLSFHGNTAAKIRKGAGIALFVVGATGMINWYFTPPSHLPWKHNEAEAFAAAKTEAKGVMIDFWAEWCIPCKKLEAVTFADFEVKEAIIEGFVPLKFDVTEDNEEDEARRKKYKATNLPAVIFLDADGNEMGRVNTDLPPKEFLERMRNFGAAAKL
jgi:thiol:disulfide interchange protein DsbD